MNKDKIREHKKTLMLLLLCGGWGVGVEEQTSYFQGSKGTGIPS